MAHAGIIPYVLPDDYTAELWARCLPALPSRRRALLKQEVARALRPGTRTWQPRLDSFIDQNEKGTVREHSSFHFKTPNGLSTRWKTQVTRIASLPSNPISAKHPKNRISNGFAGPGRIVVSANQSAVGSVGFVRSNPALDCKGTSTAGWISTKRMNIRGQHDIFAISDRYGKIETARSSIFALAAHNAGPGGSSARSKSSNKALILIVGSAMSSTR